MKKICCLVIGGYVNGYSIIQELYDHNLREIVLLDFEKNISHYSNKISSSIIVNKDSSSIKIAIDKLHIEYDLIVLYPTQDIHLEYLYEIYNDIKPYSFIAFNPETVLKYQDKIEQYKVCDRLNIPYPKTSNWRSTKDLENEIELLYPIIVKPTSRDNLSTEVFRNLILENEDDFNRHKNQIIRLIESGHTFLISEIIPGEGSDIYAYVSYTNSNGEVLGEWSGKKLSQFPNDFGVFASAKSYKDEQLCIYGRKLISEMKLWGVNEPEFKYDYRDKQYKLMEINLRPMMWHRVGQLNDVPLNYIQYLDAINDFDKSINFISKNNNTHYVNLFYEIINLISRKKYWKIFKYNVFHKPIDIAGFDVRDLKPFLYMFVVIFRKYLHKSKRDRL